MFVPTHAAPAFVIADDRRLLPRFWATVWAVQQENRGLKENSRKAVLRHLDAFYRFCDSRFGRDALDAAISERDVDAFQNAIEAFYGHLTAERYGTTQVAAWKAVRAFCLATARRLAPYSEAWRSLAALIATTANLKPPNRGKPRFIRALPGKTLADLLAVASPDADRNPFVQHEVRWRNWLIVNLLLLAGLRRGESLLLHTDSLKSDVDRRSGQVVFWLDVTTTDDDDKIDPRTSRPSIKTELSHRQVPISSSLAALYNHYLSEIRRGGEGHAFLLTSQQGGPLSAESVSKLFNTITTAISDEARKAFLERSGGKENVSPHDLRHTCATARYSAFMRHDHNRDLAFQRLRAFFGWSPTSEMPEHYARAAVQDDLLATWDALFESRLELLRGVE